MLVQLRASIVMLVLLTLLTGVLYPIAVTGMAQVAFSGRANGSLVEGDKGMAGSELIGQNFSKPEYFWGRLSATSPVPYNAASSGGSNFGPSHPDLKKAVQGRVDALVAAGSPAEEIPVDLVTSSGSGLDPHISPAAAAFQIGRVAKARGVSEDEVRTLVTRHTEARQLGLLGEPRVNVLLLNLELDKITRRK